MKDVDAARALIEGVKAPFGDPMRPRMIFIDGELRVEAFPAFLVRDMIEKWDDEFKEKQTQLKQALVFKPRRK